MNEEDCKHDLSAARRKIIHDVNTHGWHVMKVLPSARHAGWAFSIGLHRTFGHPEVVIFGLGLDTMHQIINVVGEAVRSGRVFAAEAESDQLLQGYSCALRTVDPVWHPQILGYAVWFYDRAVFPALQLIWPDKQHHYPWHDGFNPALLTDQPLLFHNDATQARVQAFVQSPEEIPGQPGSSP